MSPACCRYDLCAKLGSRSHPRAFYGLKDAPRAVIGLGEASRLHAFASRGSYSQMKS